MTLPVPIVDQISSAMSITSLRHQVIASNIANRDAQGYQRLKLAFDRALDAAAPPRVVPDTAGAPASLEHDLVELSGNALHYEAMARVLSRYFSIVGAIASSRS